MQTNARLETRDKGKIDVSQNGSPGCSLYSVLCIHDRLSSIVSVAGAWLNVSTAKRILAGACRLERVARLSRGKMNREACRVELPSQR